MFIICRTCECYGLGICQACKAEQALAEPSKDVDLLRVVLNEREEKETK